MKLSQVIAERKPDDCQKMRNLCAEVEAKQERKQYRRKLQKYVLKNRDRMLFSFLTAIK